ncbi:hypothetical protein BKA64DRAFT_645433 [Cadophora sp. MPI-SDFR-AT-0126]|nr:hypothetical protein BKA64DRAFT_645433 [Leotiomycetes sp. MPI-SDFR-AT-0126]
MTVDFHIFAGVPASVWAEFPELVQLTIGIYPYEVISDREAIPDRDLGFVKPQKGPKCGRRADWVLMAASAALRAVGHRHRHWKVPELEVLVRQTGDAVDNDVEEQWTEDLGRFVHAVEPNLESENATKQDQGNLEVDSDLSGSQHINQDVSDEEEEDDDSGWYKQADALMKQTVSQAEIRLLKHKYHPSAKIMPSEFRTRPWDTWQYQDDDDETWVWDSETESGGNYPDRPYVHSCKLQKAGS